MNRRTLVLGALVIAAVGFGAAAYLAPAKETETPVAADNNLVRQHSPVIGPEDAPVTIVEFLDPSCEACRAFYPIVKQILAANPEKTRLVIRYAPLHEGSDEAVRIIEAARLQDRFLPVMDKLFYEQAVWAAHDGPNIEKAWEFAGQTGLDIDKAKRDAQSAEISAILKQDIADMQAINLEGTPTFFVNGKPLPEFGPQQLQDLVAAEVKAAGG